VVGTADYIAPEVLKREEAHTPMLDYWSIGIIIYELMTGGLPFNDESPEKIFKNILAFKMKYPPIGTEDGMISEDAHDLMKKLIEPDPKKRLGSGGVDEIKNHPFFKNVDWDNWKEMDTPFIPVGKDIDTIYFPKANAQDKEIDDITEDFTKGAWL